MAVADFDRDGHADVAVVGDNAPCGPLGAGRARATARSTRAVRKFAVGEIRAVGIVAGDINGDGKPDLIVQHNGQHFNHLTVLLNDAQPTSGCTLDDSFTYQAEDGSAPSNVTTVRLQILPVNHAPVITSVPVDERARRLAVHLRRHGADQDAGDTLAFALAGAPSGMAIDPDSGLVQWVPAPSQTGIASVTVRVYDSSGASARAELRRHRAGERRRAGRRRRDAGRAQTTITGAGLTVGAITTHSSPTVPAGSVISQTPPAGTKVAEGTAVALGRLDRTAGSGRDAGVDRRRAGERCDPGRRRAAPSRRPASSPNGTAADLTGDGDAGRAACPRTASIAAARAWRPGSPPARRRSPRPATRSRAPRPLTVVAPGRGRRHAADRRASPRRPRTPRSPQPTADRRHGDRRELPASYELDDRAGGRDDVHAHRDRRRAGRERRPRHARSDAPAQRPVHAPPDASTTAAATRPTTERRRTGRARAEGRSLHAHLHRSRRAAGGLPITVTRASTTAATRAAATSASAGGSTCRPCACARNRVLGTGWVTQTSGR